MAKRNIRINDKYALRFTNYSVMDAEERMDKYISDVFEEMSAKKVSVKNFIILFRAALLHHFEDESDFTIRKASEIMDEFEFAFVLKKVSEALQEYMNPKGEKAKNA